MIKPSEYLELIARGVLIREASPQAPELYLGSWNNRKVVLKTYHRTSIVYKHLIGRLAIDREWWALNALSGTGFAPRPLARPNPWSIAMEFIEGVPLEQLPTDYAEVSDLLLQSELLLTVLSQAGIAHGDLGHDYWSAYGREANLIVKSGGKLVAIDFAGAWNLKSRWPIKRLGLAMQAHDHLLPTKILYHFAQDKLPDHPGWTYPSKRKLAWWELMKLLGKI